MAYTSSSNDPWFNLSFEDWLLRNTPPHQPVLFTYRNRPCVVIGRNQNPWKETTPRDLRAKPIPIPLVRRRSGGGTVFHDMGNTNFSIMLPRLLFTRRHGADLVARAVRDGLGIEACGVNERNDVVIRDGDRELKVSGSAYKIIQHRAYHHGTMLVSSSLSDLGQALHCNSANMDTKGVPSHRSPVTTLNLHLPPSASPIKHSDFVQAVIAQFGSVYAGPGKRLETREIAQNDVKESKVRNGVEELKSWEWTYGQTPEFSHLIEGRISIGDISASLTCRRALLTSMTFHLAPARYLDPTESRSTQTFLDALALSLIGKRYESLQGADGQAGPRCDTDKYRNLGLEVVSWLRKNM